MLYSDFYHLNSLNMMVVETMKQSGLWMNWLGVRVVNKILNRALVDLGRAVSTYDCGWPHVHKHRYVEPNRNEQERAQQVWPNVASLIMNLEKRLEGKSVGIVVYSESGLDIFIPYYPFSGLILGADECFLLTYVYFLRFALYQLA